MQSILWRKMLVLGVGGFALAHCGPSSPPPDVGMPETSPPIDATLETGVADVPPTDTVVMDSTPMACGMSLGVCNPATSEGCPAEQACYIAAGRDGGPPTGQCNPPGPGGVGTACASANACQRGLQCLNNVCTRMCCADGANEVCRVGGGRAICVPLRLSGVTTPLFNCETTNPCDWFAQNCPNANETCLPIRADGTSRCQPAGTVALGDPCMGMVCRRGAICAGVAGMPNTCRQICNPLPGGRDGGVPDGGVPMDCPAGQRCGAFNPADFPMNFGACLPM